jgi:glutathione-regulated potassium-efflux system ancillary protein KefC/glutathione-regulated potassium-efflux system protein KefB
MLRISEFGVVLLLFVIGLELQPSRLWILRRAVFGAGGAQMLLCTLLVGGAAWLVTGDALIAFVIGFGLAMSSTALVLQVLAERGQLKTIHGRIAFGMLLFQDLAVMPMLAALPLATASKPGAEAAGMALLKLLAVVGVVVMGGRWLLRPVLRMVARTRVTEVFTAATLLIVIGVAWLVNLVGLSMSLGAFLAGVLLADSEFRHELEADIEPFKGLLLGLFFISVGMSANLGLFATAPLLVGGITLGFMVLKFIGIAAVGRMAKAPRDAAWRLGWSMVAGGEFAFVLFGLAVRQALIDTRTADLLILAVTLSMVMGPLLLAAYDATLHRRFRRAEERPFDTIEDREGRVLIAGFGRFGQIVGRVLRARRIPFTALDSSSANIDFIRRFGSQAYYGDASRLDVLRAAGADKATVFVLAIDDMDASIRTAEIVRQHFPHLRLLVRARNRQHAFKLMETGVHVILRETYASSLEMAEAVLEALGDSAGIARSTVRRFREADEATLERQFSVRDDDLKFLTTTKEATQQLEKLFDGEAPQEEPKVRRLRV